MQEPRVFAPTAAETSVLALQKFLKERIADGAEFNPGETIQMGWMWFEIGADEDGLTILGPSKSVMPIEFEADCSIPLNTILRQRCVCDSFEVEPGWCDALKTALIVKDLANCKSWYMDRMDEGNEGEHPSGWFVGADDSDLDVNCADNLKLVSLWELFCMRNEIVDFFLLPENWQVYLKDDGPLQTCFS